jgi:hypothetical protein
MKLPGLSLTRPLLRWLREDPQWSRQDWRLRAALGWRAALGSFNQGLSQAQPSGPQQGLTPLLVLGPWRSGTTVMHELLTAALQWPTPLTWQCMDASAFRLLKAPRQDVMLARPMDGLALGALSPQEDEFALLTLGVDSAYRAFWMPHRLTELHATLDQQHWLDKPDWLDTWESFLRAVACKSEGLILKSPNHSFRVQAIVRRFPAARVVWMLRDPAAIYHSNRKMWRTMFIEHGLTAHDPDALDRFLAQALIASAEALRWARAHLPAGQIALCRQEALHQEPEREVGRVLDMLGLKGNADALAAAVRRTSSGRVERYAEAPPPAVEAAIDLLRQAQSEALA